MPAAGHKNVLFKVATGTYGHRGGHDVPEGVVLQASERVVIKAGYKVVCEADGECAQTMARKHKPDLILVDMILPKISGPELLARQKKDAATADIPVVVLSSLTEKNRQKVVEAGAEDYVERIL